MEAEQDVLFGRLQWLMLVRLVLVTALFALVLALRLRSPGPTAGALTAIYPMFIAFYALSLLYAMVAKRVPNLELFVYLQFAADAACIGLLLLFTGGPDSVFTLLFVFPILGASYLRLELGGPLVATFSVVAYLAALLLGSYGLSVDPGVQEFVGLERRTAESLRTYSTVAFHLVSFYLVAFLSSSLARKQAETGRALAETTNHLQRLQSLHGRIVQNMDAGLLTFDDHGRVTSFNRSAENLVGVPASRAVGRRLDEVLEGMSGFVAATSPGASMPPGGMLERWAVRPDGERIFLRASTSVMRDASGEVDGTILLFEDRTALVKMEERLQREERLAAVGRLSAGIAHEIRNPLASIKGSVQVLRAEVELGPEDDELLGIVEREADRLGRLVTDFLSLTREEAPQLKPGRVGDAVRELLVLVHRQGLDDGIAIESRIAYDPLLAFDSARMRQLLWNLVNNACQAMGGGGTLRVGLYRADQTALRAARLDDAAIGDLGRLIDKLGWADAREGAVARLIVEDTGPGIDTDALRKVFDPFYTTRSGGTGLGLAIVARIVEAHSGVVTVRSVAGKGTRFSLWLPILEDAEVTAVHEEDASMWVEEEVVPPRLTLVDAAGSGAP